jgi:NADPH2:quinone reductase
LADEGRLVIIATQGGAVANNINISTVMRRRLVITGSTLRPRPIEFKAKIAQSLKQNIWPLLIAPSDNAYVDGRLQPIVHSVFSALEKSGAADAHRLMDSGKFIGKIVLQWK